MVSVGIVSIDTAVAQARSTPAQTLDAFSEGSPQSEVPARRPNARSVLGIEVRSSHEKNIGRIVDVLADRSGGVEAAVIEFGGFLGIGTRKFAIAWSDLRFENQGKQLVAVLDIPRDQLLSAQEYKADAPTIVTKVIEPLMPSTEEPPIKVAPVPTRHAKETPSSRRPRRHRLHQSNQLVR